MAEHNSLERLHSVCYDACLRLARRRLRQNGAAVQDAPDVVQQAFCLAAEKDISGHAAQLQWLITTIGYLCMNQLKNQRRTSLRQQKLIRQRLDNSVIREPYAVEMQPGGMDECEMRILMEQALTEEEWQLLQRYSLGEASIEELAEECGTSPAALRVKVCRLRKKLRKEYYGVE